MRWMKLVRWAFPAAAWCGLMALAACNGVDTDGDESAGADVEESQEPAVEPQGPRGSLCGFGGQACDAGLLCCSDLPGQVDLTPHCVDPNGDDYNCGACGNHCTGDSHCIHGYCGF